MLMFWRESEKFKMRLKKTQEKKRFYNGFLFVFWKTSVFQATVRIA